MKNRSAITIAIIFTVIIASTASTAYGQSTQVANAESATINAYNAITEAHQAGADTTQLIEQLNTALNLTSQAKQAQTNNPQEAETLANQAIEIAQNVTQQAHTAQQTAENTLPIAAITTASALVVAGIAIYFLGPKIYWNIWLKLRKNYRLNTKKTSPNKNALVITAEQICAIALAITVILALISVSGLILPTNRGEQFSELGILGPNMKLGDYPSKIVSSETIHLYGYVGNQMGQPMYYTVMVKLGDNNTAVNPANTDSINQYSQVLDSNQSWTFPIDLTLTKVGDNQRVLFELWIYNQTINQNQYHERWGQIWLNVTSPAT
ncbi:MAG: DUF1616 domain-containing protein [Methanocella sp.]|jgi:hypothetical protein